MITAADTADPLAIVKLLRDAINTHDLAALVGCFATDFRSDLPTFPDASFIGNKNIRRNWELLLAADPDMTAEIVRSTTDGDDAWVEWEQRGTRTNGQPHLVRGVVIFTVTHGHIASNRLYLHQVRSGPPDVLAP